MYYNYIYKLRRGIESKQTVESFNLLKEKEDVMKKAIGLFMALTLLVPLIVNAVVWGPANSNQFRWPVSGVKNAEFTKISQPTLAWKSDVSKGIVTIHYTMSSLIKSAKLDIYNVNGVLIRNFDLGSVKNSIQWNIGKENVAAGIYVASLRYGNVEKNIQISIVK